MKRDMYEKITDAIIAKLEAGVAPWRKPWASPEHQPANLVSGRRYHGINAILLGCTGYDSPYWVTFNQARKLGGKVSKGSKGMPIIFWKFLTKDKDGTETTIPILRGWTVFNVEQCEGIEHKRLKEWAAREQEERPQHERIAAAEGIWDSFDKRPDLMYQEARAFYSPMGDYINMPKLELFESPEEYYSTFFHEMVHATGHKDRLNRTGVAGTSHFGSHEYSREELIAEMGSAFLCAEVGIEAATIDNSAAYIKGWLKALKSDKKMIVAASGAAQKATHHILGTQFEEIEDDK